MLKWTEMVIKLSNIPLGTSLQDTITLTANILMYLSNLSSHWPFEMVDIIIIIIIIIYDKEVEPQRG